MIKISVSFNNSPPSARQRLFILFLFLSVALAICPRGPRHRSPAGINSSTLGKSNLPVAADHVQILHVRGLGQIGQLHVTGGIWFQVSPTSGPSARLLSWKSATLLVFLCHHSVRSVQFKHPSILFFCYIFQNTRISCERKPGKSMLSSKCAHPKMLTVAGMAAALWLAEMSHCTISLGSDFLCRDEEGFLQVLFSPSTV